MAPRPLRNNQPFKIRTFTIPERIDQKFRLAAQRYDEGNYSKAVTEAMKLYLKHRKDHLPTATA